MTGTLEYLDQQIETLRGQMPAAVGAFDPGAIHQSRVATRRVKAAFDILRPLLVDLNAAGLDRAGRKLRRSLGPLRDLDVMIDHLADARLPARSAPAVEWARRAMLAQRVKAHADGAIGQKKQARLSARFDDWWRVRHALEGRLEAVTPLLGSALHERFAAFAGLADVVAGVAAPTPGAPPVDVHELRIDGKAVRLRL